MMGKNNPMKYPGLFISVDDRPVEVEVPILLNSVEGWQVFAILKAARRLHFLTTQCLPLLKAASLLEPNEHVDALEELMSIIQEDVLKSQRNFMQQRAYQQSMLHDPKGLRPKPQTSLFKL